MNIKLTDKEKLKKSKISSLQTGIYQYTSGFISKKGVKCGHVIHVLVMLYILERDSSTIHAYPLVARELHTSTSDDVTCLAVSVTSPQ
jgi:hypothetical protein